MSGDIIKEFLVGLGFQVDKAGQDRFTAAIASVSKGAAEMAAGLASAAAAVTGFTAKIADGLEQVYFASQRTGAAAENIKALGYAAAQAGAGAGAAQGSLEGLARFLRSNPGSTGFLASLGVNTRDANGQLRDTSILMADLGKRFQAMPFFQANAYANVLGIDERTLLALRSGELQRGVAEYGDLVRRSGVDMTAATQGSHEFMSILRSLGATFDILATKVAASLTKGVGGNLAAFRELLLSNMDRISQGLTVVGKAIIAAADLVTRTILAVGDGIKSLIGWYHDADGPTQGWIRTLGALAAALAVVGAAAMLNPATAAVAGVLALAGAIALLWEDYRVWKEGGKSLIDWAAWEPAITAASNALKAMGHLLGALKDAALQLAPALTGMFDFSLKGILKDATKDLQGFADLLNNVTKLVLAIQAGDWSAAKAALGALYDQSGIREGLNPPPGSDAEKSSRMADGFKGWWGRTMPTWLGGSSAAGPSTATPSADKAAFIAKWGPEAQRIAADLGTSPENILAHWGQETAWGRSEHDNNVGNLQAPVGTPGTVTRGDTHADGTPYKTSFYAYRTPAEAADAYKSWILRHGAPVQGTGSDPVAYGNALRSRGYMENPNAPADIARARLGLVIPNATPPDAPDLSRGGAVATAPTFGPSDHAGQVALLRAQADAAMMGFRAGQKPSMASLPAGGGDGGATLNQNTVINMQGGDADAASRIAMEQARLNQQLVRNLQGAAR